MKETFIHQQLEKWQKKTLTGSGHITYMNDILRV